MKTLRNAIRLARQCLLVSTALFSVCWAVHAQNLTKLSSVDFDGSSSTYTTNFNFSEAGTPLAFWNSGIGVTNSDGVDPGTLFAGYYDALLDPRGDLTGDGFTDDSDFVQFAASYDRLVCP